LRAAKIGRTLYKTSTFAHFTDNVYYKELNLFMRMLVNKG